MVHLTLRDLRALRAGVDEPVAVNEQLKKVKHRSGPSSKDQKQRKEPPSYLATVRAVREGMRVRS